MTSKSRGLLPDAVLHFMDLTVVLGTITARRMFGGTGIYCDGTMFALEADDEIYLKVDDTTRSVFENAGSEPFVYKSKDRTTTMSYYRIPEDAVDDRDPLIAYAMLAVEAAQRAKRAKRTRKHPD